MTSFTTHSANQVIASADINLIQTAVNTLEGQVDPKPLGQGFLSWAFDPPVSTAASSIGLGLPYVASAYFKSCTVTNLHCFVVVAGTTTHFHMALYNSSGTLLAQTADHTSDGSVTGLKTYALSSPQVISAGWYYIALACAGSSPQFFQAPLANDQIMNATGPSPAIAFRASTSGTAYTTTMPSPLGTLTAKNKMLWVAAS